MKTQFRLTLLVIVLLGTSPASANENWMPVGMGVNGVVRAAVVDELGTLYIGGGFTMATNNDGTAVAVNRIAKWDGNNWSALGSGADSDVWALAVSGGDLYVGGIFATAGGVAANQIAKWDGNSWSALDSGMNNSVFALAVVGSDVYAGGYFTTAGGAMVNCIAKWDGNNWSALGSGMSNSVYYTNVWALAVSGDDLYAGGAFTTAGGAPADRIAKWDGDHWSALGAGIGDSSINSYSYQVYALAVSGDVVFAGGNFRTAGGVPANGIAKWDGSSWNALSTGISFGGVNRAVYALAVSGNDVYAGGNFVAAGGNPAFFFTKWDGTNWSALGSGMNNSVLALAVSDNDLYAGGWFTTAGGNAANYIAKRILSTFPLITTQPQSRTNIAETSTTFSLAVAGIAPLSYQWRKNGAVLDGAVGKTYSLSSVQAGDAGDYDVVVTNSYGSVTSAVATLTVVTTPVITVQPSSRTNEFGTTATFSVSALGIAPLGYQWRKSGVALNGQTANTLAFAEVQMTDAGNYDVVVTNNFGSVTSVVAKLTVVLDWRALGAGLNGAVQAVGTAGDTAYAGGLFTLATNNGGATIAVNRIAKWGGNTWSVLGGGLNGDVKALATVGSNLYVGGSFTWATNSGGVAVSVSRIAKWDGSSWSALGTGMDWWVRALAVSGSNVYAGGDFNSAGGVSAYYVARWNGSSWSALGPGVDGRVWALAVSGSVLYAGGDFRFAGGTEVNYIARWNGSWSALGTGMNEYVRALTVAGSDVYAGGLFSTAGGVAASRIVRWNGSSWSALGLGCNTPVWALAVSGNDLYVGGNFSQAGGVEASYIAKWNGSSWSTLGSGTDANVLALATTENHLFVGGEFTTAGGTSAANIARWTLGNVPLITLQPQSRTNEAGTSVSFAVTATGSTPLTYQWRKNEAMLTGEITNILTLSNVQLEDAADYDVVVGNGFGSVTSAVATLTVEGAFNPPGITAHPESRTNIVGTAASFSVSATGAAPLAYQWRKDEVALNGETTSALQLNSVGLDDAANYDVVITNHYGSVTSVVATLTVVLPSVPPVINVQPESQTNVVGMTATFAVSATGTAPLAYQWRKDSVALSGATTDILALNNVQLGEAGDYDVVVTNNYGSVTSVVATLTVVTLPEITVQPQSRTNEVGTTATFAVSATGTAPLTYQWRKGGAALNGETTDTLTLANVQTADAGNYDVVVTNHYGSVTSVVASLTVVTTNESGWSALGSGMDDIVWALAVSGNAVYAGGAFTTAGGVSVNKIAKWDGNSWSALGTGMNGDVFALAVAGNDLYAGGNFTTAGGVSANRIARWDGSTWSPVGSGMNGVVHALAVSENDLFAGGAFTTAGGNSANRIAKWTGSSWTALGGGMESEVLALAAAEDDLYAGGYFSVADETLALYVAKWNGAGWNDMELGMDLVVEALAVSGADVFASGWFEHAGVVAANRVAKWDGSSWGPLGVGMNNRVLALAMLGNDLYAGGTFTMAGGVARSRIAKWDGNVWSGLGTGVNGTVRALAASGNAVYVGGGFSTAGGVTVNRIAKWTVSASTLPLLFNTTDLAINSGEFQTRLTGPENALVVIENSTNLVQWTPLATNTLPAAGLPLSFPKHTNSANFYRARYHQ